MSYAHCSPHPSYFGTHKNRRPDTLVPRHCVVGVGANVAAQRTHSSETAQERKASANVALAEHNVYGRWLLLLLTACETIATRSAGTHGAAK